MPSNGYAKGRGVIGQINVWDNKFAFRLQEMSGKDETYEFNLMKDSDNYSSLYSLALVAAVNRYQLKVFYVETRTIPATIDPDTDEIIAPKEHICDIKGLEIPW